jgi:hypothetical protein
MLPDEIFTVASTRIKAQLDKPINIIPIGDVHLGSPACDEDRLNYMLDWIASKPDTYIIGTGDYCDLMRAHDRMEVERNVADGTKDILDRLYREEADKFWKKLKPFASRVLGLGEGNHRGNLKSGITTTQYMCDRLGTKYLGYMSYFALNINVRSTTSIQIVFLIHHGMGGGGKLAGTTINRVEQLEKVAIADIYMMGHDHQKGVRPTAKFVPYNGSQGFDFRTKKQLLISTGGFLKSYMPNMPSYAVRSAYRPADLGCAKIMIIPHRDRKNGEDLMYYDLHASV